MIRSLSIVSKLFSHWLYFTEGVILCIIIWDVHQFNSIVVSLYIPEINLSKPNNKIEKSVKNFSIFRTDNMFNTRTSFSYNYNIFILLCKNECRIYLNIMTGKTFVNLGCYFPCHFLANLLIQKEWMGWNSQLRVPLY